MPDFQRSTTVNVDPERAFMFLADPANLPRYVAEMVLAQPEDGERLRVAAHVEGRHEEGDARFHTDPFRRYMEWSGEPSSSYRGSLQVSESGTGSSVTIRLHDERDENALEINRVLDETMKNIERLLGTA